MRSDEDFSQRVTTKAFPDRCWHAECFACFKCKSPLEGSFKHKDGEVFCEKCYEDFLPKVCVALLC